MYYTIDDIGEGVGKEWKGGVGYVTREIATAHMPPPSDDNLVLICGPPPMYKALSGEKKSPKDQGNWKKLHCCTAAPSACRGLVSAFGLTRTVLPVIPATHMWLLCRGAVRNTESNGLHRTAGVQVLSVSSVVSHHVVHHIALPRLTLQFQCHSEQQFQSVFVIQ